MKPLDTQTLQKIFRGLVGKDLKGHSIKEDFGGGKAIFFDGLSKGVDKKNGGVDVKHLSCSGPFLRRFLTRIFQHVFMGEDTFQALFPSAM